MFKSTYAESTFRLSTQCRPSRSTALLRHVAQSVETRIAVFRLAAFNRRPMSIKYDSRREPLAEIIKKATVNATYVIPDLQRPYVWTPRQVKRDEVTQ